MAFDQAALDQARQSGYSDDEIYSHLSGTDPKFAEAQQNGYKLDDVAAHLTPKPSVAEQFSGDPTQAIQQYGQGPSVLSKIGEAVKQAVTAQIPTSQPGPEQIATSALPVPIQQGIQGYQLGNQIVEAAKQPLGSQAQYNAAVNTAAAVAPIVLPFLPKLFKGFGEAKPSGPTLTDTLFPKAPEPVTALPDWAREQMLQKGLDPARIFNDVDTKNPSVVEAINNDPSLTPEQKANVLATGSPEAAKNLQDVQQESIKSEIPQKGELVDSGAKQPWQMTRDEALSTLTDKDWGIENRQQYGPGALHARAVEQAVAEGKPVPPEVLAEYPEIKPTTGEPTNAIEPSNAQVEGGQAPLGVQEGATGQVPSTGSSDNALREAQGGEARGQVPGTEALSSEQSTPAVGKDISLPDVPKPEGENIGLTKDYISQDREARGEEPLAQQARKSNPETWDNAAKTFQANPNAGHELVASIINNPERGVSEDDMGVLLRHKVDLSNQTDFNYERLKSPDTTPEEKGAAITQMAALRDARNNADLAVDAVGTRAGRSLQFLQKMSTDDYSLSSMQQERSAAIGGQDLTPKQVDETAEYSKDILAKDKAWQDYQKTNAQQESALKAYKTRLKTATTDYERRAAFQEFEPQIRRQLELDPEAVQLKSDLAQAKNNWQSQLVKDQLANRPMWQKILGGVSWAARESALSGYHTLAKLAGFTSGQLVNIPLTQTAERLWGTIPGFKDIAAQSEYGPGAGAQALGKLYSTFFTTGMKQAYKQLTTGTSDFKAQYDGDKIGLQYPSFFGNLHGAEKTPLRMGATEMSRQRIIDKTMNDLSSQAVSKGQDITDPVVQGGINKLAFDAGTRDILMENNMFADKVNGLLRSMEAPQKATGQPSPALNVLSTLAKTFLTKGIVRTPANFVKQVFESSPAGLGYGLARGAAAIYKGVGNIAPGEATAIMRLLGKGSVGSGMFLWGALDALRPPDQRIFGGYYQPGEKRNPNDVKFASVRLGGVTAPHYFTHNLLTEPAQMGATMMRVARSSLSKKDSTNKGLITGALTSVLGLAEQAPVANPAFRADQLTNPATTSIYVGDAIRGLIPQLVQNVAADLDKSESGRKAKTIPERIKLGIPKVRETLPEKGQKREPNR